jgi:pimeloyl-ACP methyl ester carboxylesterase
MTTTDRRADVRGTTLAYELSGEGPDLVWGHGLSQTMALEDQLPLIDWARVPARVLRYDARGHGLSTSTPDLAGYQWSELARDQLALATACGIDRYVVAGASMGCGTALHVGVLAPERVRGLVLVIPPTAWETRAAQAAQWAAASQMIEEQGVEAFIAARAAVPLPDPFADDESRRDKTAEAARSWDPRRLALVLRGAAGADLPTRDEIAAITAPTLVLAWTGDPIHPESTANALGALIPHATVSVASKLDEVARWTEQLTTFIGELGTD